MNRKTIQFLAMLVFLLGTPFLVRAAGCVGDSQYSRECQFNVCGDGSDKAVDITMTESCASSDPTKVCCEKAIVSCSGSDSQYTNKTCVNLSAKPDCPTYQAGFEAVSGASCGKNMLCCGKPVAAGGNTCTTKAQRYCDRDIPGFRCGTNEKDATLTCPKSQDNLNQICCIQGDDSETDAGCLGKGGTCKVTCSSTENPVAISATDCPSENYCCKPKDSNPPIGDGGAGTPCAGGTVEFGICIPNVGLPAPSGGVTGIVSNLLSWLLGIFGIVAIISFVVSGIMYFISAGDDDMMGKAKKAMTYSIIGVVVALSGFVIIQAIDSALSGTNPFF